MEKSFAPAKSLPVLMYHYVNDYKNTLAVSCVEFEDHCRTLAEKGWRGISLAEAEAYAVRAEPLPEKSVLFTFDDGYLDNYRYAMPILHKYGHKGVMFAVTDRVESGQTPRAAVADVLNGTAASMPLLHRPVRKDALRYDKREDVFCNEAEIKAMDAAGVMAVASHSRGHLGVYTGSEYSGVFRPGHQRRTFYRTPYPQVWGMPAFTVKPGLLHRGFVPNAKLVKAVTQLVPQEYAEADAFFADSAKAQMLQTLLQDYAGKLGNFESDSERAERMRREIVGGKSDLEVLLGHSVQTLCWPWGAYCPEALQIGKDAGFTAFFTTKEGVNIPGNALAIHRFKSKARNGQWLLSRVKMYARPWIGWLYAKMRM